MYVPVGVTAIIAAAFVLILPNVSRADGEREILFRSPSGNLVCDIWKQVAAPDPTGQDNEVDCTIRHWAIPPDRPFTYALSANGRVRNTCV